VGEEHWAELDDEHRRVWVVVGACVCGRATQLERERERERDVGEGEVSATIANAGDRADREGRLKDKVLVEWQYFRLKLWSI